MLNKLIALFLAFSLTMCSVATAAQLQKPEHASIDKILVVEVALYGNEQPGAMIERTLRLERELFGLPGKEALLLKIERIYSYVKESTAAQPSLIYKINVLQWTLLKVNSNEPIKNRLETLEKTVAGTISSGPVDSRVDRLIGLTLPKRKLELISTTFSKDTLIKIKTVTPLSTKTNKVGDPVEFEAVDDIFISGALIIPKGAEGSGKIVKIGEAQNFGRDGKLEVNFEQIQAIDMTAIPTYIGE